MQVDIKKYKCEHCGSSKFILSSLYQISYDYKVLSNGKLSKNYKKSTDLCMECNLLLCSNCGKSVDDFTITDGGKVYVDIE